LSCSPVTIALPRTTPSIRKRSWAKHSYPNTAPTLWVVIDDYLKRSGLDISPDYEVDNLAMAMPLIASTHGVALPAYAKNFLPLSVISRPIQGDTPTIDLIVGCNKTNTSPILKLFLSRVDDLTARTSSKTHRVAGGGEPAYLVHSLSGTLVWSTQSMNP